MVSEINRKDFHQQIALLDIATIPITWVIHHHFGKDHEPTVFEGNFHLQFLLDQQTYILQENPANIQAVDNPFPLLQITHIPSKETTTGKSYQVKIPSYRITSATVDQNRVHFTFQPHGNHPITDFPTELPLAWGKVEIKGNQTQNVAIITTLIEILYIAHDIPRPTCKTCQSLEMINVREPPATSEFIGEEEFICFDCLQSALMFYNSLEEQMMSLDKSDNIDGYGIDILDLIDSGLTLADNLMNEKLHFEFLSLRAFILCKLKTPESLEEGAQLLEDIILFATNWGYASLKDHAQYLLTNLSPLQREAFEDQGRIEKTQDPSRILVTKGSELLRQARDLEGQGKFQTAIENIYEAATILVEEGAWREEELTVAQQEVARLKELITIKASEPKPILSPASLTALPTETAPPVVLQPIKPPKLQKKLEDVIKEAKITEIDVEETSSDERQIPKPDQEQEKIGVPALRRSPTIREDTRERSKRSDNLVIPLPPINGKIQEVTPLQTDLLEDIPQDDEPSHLNDTIQAKPELSEESLPKDLHSSAEINVGVPESSEPSATIEKHLPIQPSTPNLSSPNTAQDVPSSQSDSSLPQDPLKSLETRAKKAHHTKFTAFSKRSFFFGASRQIPKPPDSEALSLFKSTRKEDEKAIDRIQKMMATYEVVESPITQKKKLPAPQPDPYPDSRPFQPKSQPKQDSLPQTQPEEKLFPQPLDSTSVFKKQRRTRRQRSQANQSRVQICPMCGNVSKNCHCGYMSSKK